MKRHTLVNWFLFAILVGLVIWLITMVSGCTLTEWLRIKKDAEQAAPTLVDEVIKNPTSPAGIITAVITYILGLVTKSAARGFGKAGKAAWKKVKPAVTVDGNGGSP